MHFKLGLITIGTLYLLVCIGSLWIVWSLFQWLFRRRSKATNVIPKYNPIYEKSGRSPQTFDKIHTAKNTLNIFYQEAAARKQFIEKLNRLRSWGRLEETHIEQFHTHIAQVRQSIHESQYNAILNVPMIPLCVAYTDKDTVKQLGATWYPLTKTWFWPFEADSKPVLKWLPKAYQPPHQATCIQMDLVPQPLWGQNLRSFLGFDRWHALKTKINQASGYRCRICGCSKGETLIECHEQWSYAPDTRKQLGVVYFKGLESLCTECHQVKHLGKARANGQEACATARLMFLNNWSFQEATLVIDAAFATCKQLSTITRWDFNFTQLKQRYGMTL